MRKTNLFKSVAVLGFTIISTASVFAASTTSSNASNSLATVGGVALLIAAIVLPAMKSSK